MSDLHMEAATDQIGPDAATLASLPPPLAHRIFLALPADARTRLVRLPRLAQHSG